MVGIWAKQAALALAMAFSWPVSLGAQELGVPVLPILTIDVDRVFSSTITGQRISAAISTSVAELSAENRRIEGELAAEELALTETRKTMSAEEFKPLADAFDQKVQKIRAEQEAKERRLQQLQEAETQEFLATVAPVLSSLGNKYGAVVLLDRRNVLLAADGVDITDEAIERIDQALSERGDARGNAPEGGAAVDDQQ